MKMEKKDLHLEVKKMEITIKRDGLPPAEQSGKIRKGVAMRKLRQIISAGFWMQKDFIL